MNGVVVIDKPSGCTSFDVVRKVRQQLKVKKAGHTGTLDPLATGVLAVCVGDATKIAGYLTDGDKGYEATISFGSATDTYDADGKTTFEGDTNIVAALTEEKIEAALEKFRGTYEQMAPMYSAVKQGGKRLYELAREGKEVERPKRRVTVRWLKLESYENGEARISMQATKGYFVRTLAHELGEALKCGAHLKALRRTLSGPFELSQAIELESLTADNVKLTSMGEALAYMPSYVVPQSMIGRVKNGVSLPASGQGQVRVVGPQEELLAIAEIVGGKLKYGRVFA